MNCCQVRKFICYMKSVCQSFGSCTDFVWRVVGRPVYELYCRVRKFGVGWCNLRKVHPGEISLLKGISNDVWPLHTDVSSVVQLQFVVIANLLLKVILTKYEDFKMKLDLNVDQICINLRCSAWLQKQQQFQSAARQQITLRRILVVALGSSSRSSSSTSRDRKTILIFSRIFRVSETKKNYSLSPEPWFPYTNTLPDYFTSEDPEGKKKRENSTLFLSLSRRKKKQ